MVSSLLPTNTIRLNKVIVYATMSNHVRFTPLNNAFNFAGFIDGSTLLQQMCTLSIQNIRSLAYYICSRSYNPADQETFCFIKPIKVKCLLRHC